MKPLSPQLMQMLGPNFLLDIDNVPYELNPDNADAYTVWVIESTKEKAKKPYNIFHTIGLILLNAFGIFIDMFSST